MEDEETGDATVEEMDLMGCLVQKTKSFKHLGMSVFVHGCVPFFL